jgi:hypothetical protein
MIGSISNSAFQASDMALAKVASETAQVSKTSKSHGAPNIKDGDSVKLSTLAQQLAASAIRAEERDKNHSRSELASKAKSIVNQIVGDLYYVNKTLHDNEPPNTSDPELLSRAKQATAYVNDASSGGRSIKNPFSGLSKEQLSYIIYDESGTYTVNERQAAWRESYDIEEAWREKVVAQAIAEYNSTGKLTNFFSSVLDHFKELPAIEQAQYPKDYTDDLQSKIDLDFNYRTHQAEGKGKHPMSLIGMIFEQAPQETNDFAKMAK